jgi:hypothetical protein
MLKTEVIATWTCDSPLLTDDTFVITMEEAIATVRSLRIIRMRETYTSERVGIRHTLDIHHDSILINSHLHLSTLQYEV